MTQPDSVKVRTRLSIPGVLSVEFDNWMGLLGSRQHRRGPYLIIGRQCGLALDTALHTTKGSVPHLWRVHGGSPQQWYLVRTPHRGECAIVSVENGMALDARTWSEIPREPVMWPKHAEAHQRWRFHRTEDRQGYIIESVLTGQVLDFPPDAIERVNPVLWDRHEGENQQFVVLNVKSGPG